LKEKNRGVHRT